jgi:UrcA family protein
MYTRFIALSGSAAITSAIIFAMAPPASAKAPIVVVAPADIVTRHISYADLNLASLAGEETLKARVGGAVRSLCDETVGGEDGSLTWKFATKHCLSSAWDQARPQISSAADRARDIATTGTSTIAAAAIVIKLPE